MVSSVEQWYAYSPDVLQFMHSFLVQYFLVCLFHLSLPDHILRFYFILICTSRKRASQLNKEFFERFHTEMEDRSASPPPENLPCVSSHFFYHCHKRKTKHSSSLNPIIMHKNFHASVELCIPMSISLISPSKLWAGSGFYISFINFFDHPLLSICYVLILYLVIKTRYNKDKRFSLCPCRA